MSDQTRRLFVGNISYTTTASGLRSLFAATDEVADIEVVTDRETGRPRGYALVTMATDAGSRDAIAKIDGKMFEGRPLHVVVEDTRPHGSLARVVRRALGYVRYARDHVGAAAVSLFLFDHDTGELRGVVAEWDWTRASFPALLSDWHTVESALATREVRLITRADATGAEAGWFEPRGIDASLCVPLCDETRRLGVLFFDFDARSGSVDRADIPFLSDVGERCARAIGRSTVD
jgi:hypothetical protein